MSHQDKNIENQLEVLREEVRNFEMRMTKMVDWKTAVAGAFALLMVAGSMAFTTYQVNAEGLEKKADVKPVEDAISQCEAHKANLEAQLTECEAELADYIAIRDAE